MEEDDDDDDDDLINGTILEKMLHIKYDSISLQLLSQMFLIPRRTERDIIKNVKRSSCKAVFLNRRAVARHRAMASIIPGREKFSWNLSF